MRPGSNPLLPSSVSLACSLGIFYYRLDFARISDGLISPANSLDCSGVVRRGWNRSRCSRSAGSPRQTRNCVIATHDEQLDQNFVNTSELAVTSSAPTPSLDQGESKSRRYRNYAVVRLRTQSRSAPRGLARHAEVSRCIGTLHFFWPPSK